MSHPAQVEFCRQVRERFPHFFSGCRVLDIGSLDINGNNRGLFDNCHYLGLDIGPGPNVDIVCSAGDHQAPDDHFDTVISTECFEHDLHYADSVRNIVRMLRPGGLFVFTCATTGRGEHGTRRVEPDASPLTSVMDGPWSEHYRNLTAVDFEGLPAMALLNPRTYQIAGADLQFFGFKRAA